MTPLASAEPILIPTAPTLPPSPLIITAYQAANDGLNFVQIYNTSDDLVMLDGMQLKYSRKSDPATIETTALTGYMLPNSHILIVSTDVLVGNDRVQIRFSPAVWEPKNVWIESTQFAPVTIPTDMKADNVIYKRSRTTTGYSTATSALSSPLSGNIIEADLLYTLPAAPALEIVEVSARARSCSPFDSDFSCYDYIKLRMKNGFAVPDLSMYRVRTGGDESITNTFSFENASIHGNYVLLHLRDDGDMISLTNSGGFIWLEDIFGITRYEDTLIEYADAGSEAYVGKSWGLNDTTAEWQWAIPNPIGANIFPVVVVTNEPIVSLSDCPIGKYRNPETNRCRTIEEAVNALAACEEGKERNPTTNRCRTIVTTAVATFAACEVGQERNPLTNRCRSVLAAAAILTPCNKGEERNPETNRCRKTMLSSNTPLPAVKDIKADMKQTTQKWWLAVTAVLLAVSYAVYEWRQEILQILNKIPAILGKK